MLAGALFVSGCAGPAAPPGEPEVKGSHSVYSLPISKRGFYLGIVATPKNSPMSSFEDLAAAYEEAGRIAEVAMVWVEAQGIGEHEALKRNRLIEGLRVHGLRTFITLNFATIKKAEGGLEYVVDAPEGTPANLSDPAFRERWMAEARELARDFRPEYISLGNEINDYFYLHPEELDAYVSLFDETKREIKKVSPETKVLVVFSYNHLLENEQWELLETFDSRADVIGITTYPWKQYGAPEDMPDDYYSRIAMHTTRPIAFTEIGWISDPPSSEKRQSQFLLRFLELTKDLDVEMVNWLFLHEMELGGVAGEVSDPRTGSIALKRRDGSEKDVYLLWLDLKDLPLEDKG
ncbi:MAG: hypothetical protein D6733_00300 [Methanobacteriota archaeon]|nr:MAG: hypothetical protein D6733_00300 [Euryarchaeota archaeon]